LSNPKNNHPSILSSLGKNEREEDIMKGEDSMGRRVSNQARTLSPVERELDERLAESFQRAAGGGHVVGPIIREPLEAIYHVISSQHTTNPTILSSLGESWILDEWLVVGGVEGGNDDRNDDWNGARQRQIAWTTSDS